MSEITIDSVYGDRDQKVGSLLQMYDQWLSARSEIEDEWQKTQNMIFATDAAQSVGLCASSTWKNNSTRGKIAQIRDNLHANYHAALMSSRNWLKWEASSNTEDMMNKKRIITAYMRNKADLSNFNKVVSDLLYDYIDYGVALGTTEWVNETVEWVDPDTGISTTVVTYQGPRAVRLSPHDTVINPTAKSIKDSPVFIRSLVTIGQIKAMAEDMPANKEFNNKCFTFFHREDRLIYLYFFIKYTLYPCHIMFLNLACFKLFNGSFYKCSVFTEQQYT